MLRIAQQSRLTLLQYPLRETSDYCPDHTLARRPDDLQFFNSPTRSKMGTAGRRIRYKNRFLQRHLASGHQRSIQPHLRTRYAKNQRRHLRLASAPGQRFLHPTADGCDFRRYNEKHPAGPNMYRLQIKTGTGSDEHPCSSILTPRTAAEDRSGSRPLSATISKVIYRLQSS